MTRGSVGINLDEVALRRRHSETFLASGTAQVNETLPDLPQRLDQIPMSEPRHFNRFLDNEAFPINPKLDLCALSDLHLFGDRGRDAKGQAIAPLQDSLRHVSTLTSYV
jgi:hypothetical protein